MCLGTDWRMLKQTSHTSTPQASFCVERRRLSWRAARLERRVQGAPSIPAPPVQLLHKAILAELVAASQKSSTAAASL